MLPIDLVRVRASASARVLARAIDEGRDADQVAALLSIVLEDVEILSSAEVGFPEVVSAELRPTNIVSLADHRRLLRRT
ncbi:hypothetical protein P6U16_13435 [Rhizobium sp. 32-5/1]|uniref:hypothetical protein n=1 Tax=Rhizobium sp. 32-5/1 TaxID=3019602 RepID=UPI00240D6666|nr:hypothetical protein [Rhizobium sp. 32-5/1]WEZ82180.1 hypothetical protein P6U16_13435 [Rhizobium sp. 32-5/1]